MGEKQGLSKNSKNSKEQQHAEQSTSYGYLPYTLPCEVIETVVLEGVNKEIPVRKQLHPLLLYDCMQAEEQSQMCLRRPLLTTLRSLDRVVIASHNEMIVATQSRSKVRVPGSGNR